MIADEIRSALSSQAAINTIVDALYNRLWKKLAFQLELRKAEQRMDALATTSDVLSKKVKELQVSLENQEQYLCRHCLWIYGLPERRNENTDKLVISSRKDGYHHGQAGHRSQSSNSPQTADCQVCAL